MDLEIRFLTHRGHASRTKPSMTNCPAYVPVMVLLCPCIKGQGDGTRVQGSEISPKEKTRSVMSYCFSNARNDESIRGGAYRCKEGYTPQNTGPGTQYSLQEAAGGLQTHVQAWLITHICEREAATKERGSMATDSEVLSWLSDATQTMVLPRHINQRGGLDTWGSCKVANPLTCASLTDLLLCLTPTRSKGGRGDKHDAEVDEKGGHKRNCRFDRGVEAGILDRGL